MTSLYDIAAEYRQTADKLADLDLDEQTIADTLEGMSGALEVKAQNVVLFARNLEVTAAAIKDAEAAMAARRKAMESRAAGLRRYALSAMQVAGVQSIECPYFKLAVRKNPPAVEVFDAARIWVAANYEKAAVSMADTINEGWHGQYPQSVGVCSA